MFDDVPHFVLEATRATLERCRLEGPAGSYRRSSLHDAEADPAACAAAANLLFSLGELPGESPEREEWLDTLRSFQDPESGLFDQGPHALPVSAACTAALSCFGARPEHPPLEHLAFGEVSGLREFLQERCWCEQPELSARETAALFVLLRDCDEVEPGWTGVLTDWIRGEVDAHTGLLRKGCIAPIEVDGEWTLMPYLCAVLYPLAICQHARQPFAMPWRLVDTSLEVMEFHHDLFFRRKGHRHLPWVYALSRSLRYTAHRSEEARQALQRFLPAYLDYLRDHLADPPSLRLTRVQWDLATLAELQLALPGALEGLPPLRQVLDHHAFL